MASMQAPTVSALIARTAGLADHLCSLSKLDSNKSVIVFSS